MPIVRQAPAYMTPDSPLPRTNLVPAAKQTTNEYMQPVVQQIPNAVQTTSLGNLANALSELNPALTKVAGHIVTEREKEMAAQAFVSAQKAQAQNVADLKEAQRLGLIPDGASPNFIRAWQTNILKLQAEKTPHDLYSDYLQNDQLRNSDDPSAFDAFAKEWKENRNKAVLYRDQDTEQYTAMEVYGSKYHETVDAAIQSVKGRHLEHRIGEREKLAAQNAGDLILQRLDAGLDSTVEPDLSKVAQSINDVFYNPTSGAVAYGGMKTSKATELMTEAIITKAVSMGDASILDVAEHIGPSKEASLAKTKIFREKAEAARQRISNIRWMDEERARKRAEYKGLGIESPEAVEQRAREDRARIEETYASEKLHRQQYAKSVEKHEAVEPELKAIIQLHALNGDTTGPEIREHLKTIAKVDPDAYKNIVTFLQTQARHGKEVDPQIALMTFTNLRAKLSDNPAKFDTREIIKAANAGRITAGQVNELFGLADSSKKQSREYPLLSSPLVNDMRSALKSAVITDPMGEYGEPRLRADKAAAELNGLIAGYLKSHPKATEWELYTAIQPHIEKLARKYSPDLNEAMSAQERRKSGAKPPTDLHTRRAELDQELSKRYPNKKQRDQVIEQLLRQ